MNMGGLGTENMSHTTERQLLFTSLISHTDKCTVVESIGSEEELVRTELPLKSMYFSFSLQQW